MRETHEVLVVQESGMYGQAVGQPGEGQYDTLVGDRAAAVGTSASSFVGEGT